MSRDFVQLFNKSCIFICHKVMEYLFIGATIKANGPAIWGGCVTRRSIRAGSWYPEYSGPENCHGARRVWRTFCRLGTNFIEHYECRGTSMIGATNLSPVTKLNAGTGPEYSGVQTISEPEICHATEVELRADVRVRV